MAETVINPDGRLIQWERRFRRSYIRQSGFEPYMGTNENAIFKVEKKLINGGDELRLPLVTPLRQRGVGTAPLVGREEAMETFWFRTRPVWRRHAVAIKEAEKQKSALDLLQAREFVLTTWFAEDLHISIMDALFAVGADETRYNEETGTGQQRTFFDATTAQLNAWQTANTRRIYVPSGPLQASLAATWNTLDTTNDLFTVEHALRMKRMARQTNLTAGERPVRPYRTEDGREWFVCFLDPANFERIASDTRVMRFLESAAAGRMIENNPLYQDGDVVYRGIIFREIPELPVLLGAGASSANVGVVSLCGAEAVAVTWGQMWKSTRRSENDYQFIDGVGGQEMRAVEKTFYNVNSSAAPGLQHGIVTGFFANQG